MTGRLEDELGGPPPRAIAELPAEATADLAAAIADARRRRRQALEDAGDRVARIAPKRLRSRVRKGLTG